MLRERQISYGSDKDGLELLDREVRKAKKELIVRGDATKPIAKNEMKCKLSAQIPMPSKRRENSCEVEC